MNVWVDGFITTKGLALLAKLIAGTKLTITRAVTGTGYVDPASLREQTSVTGETQTLNFRQITYPEKGKCSLPCRLSNSGLTSGYTAMQVGVYATDPDEGEILYFITQAPSGKGSDIPSESEAPGYIAEWDFYFQYGQADSVELSVSPADTVTIAMLDEGLKKKADTDLGNIENAVFAEKAMASQKDRLYSAGGDGYDYVVTVPGVTELYAGLSFTMIPSITSKTTAPTLKVNNLDAKPLRQPLSSNTTATTTAALATWLSAGKPVTVTFDGTLWKTDIPRPSAAYLYGTVPVEKGGTGATTITEAREKLGIYGMLKTFPDKTYTESAKILNYVSTGKQTFTRTAGYYVGNLRMKHRVYDEAGNPAGWRNDECVYHIPLFYFNPLSPGYTRINLGEDIVFRIDDQRKVFVDYESATHQFVSLEMVCVVEAQSP